MVTISVCMIVKNEECVLERCLSTVREIADELIIVDTGSTDATKEIAKKFTEQVYDFEWCDDFSKARNYLFQKLHANIVCGWMQMMYCCRRIRISSWS